MRIELDHDLTLLMEIDYGRIQIIRRQDVNNIPTRYIIFLRCACGDITKGGIKTHIARKRNALQLRYNFNYPYFPKTYRDVGSANRHIYKKPCCAYIEENIYYYLSIGQKYGHIFAQEIL